MDPGSRVELPPRGADLSFLSSNPETDTPSRWLTFNSTPGGTGTGGGNTTPGTAFGSPFWGSLIAANNGSAGGQSTSNLTPTALGLGSAGGAHSNRLSPKHYSPSKEFNPFELSFFPKHNEHLLNKNNTKEGEDKEKSSNDDADGGQSKNEETKENDRDGNGRNSLSSSVSSLKRPFSDAQQGGGNSEESSSASVPTLQSDASSRSTSNLDDANLPEPSWKRPKIEDLHQIAPVSSSGQSISSISAPSSMYADSPSATLNLNASPDSGMSPASSAMIPTPSLGHATLPLNATPGAATIFGNNGHNISSVGGGSSAQPQRKLSMPLEQIEVAKLGMISSNPATMALLPHQQQHLYNVQQQPQQSQQQQQASGGVVSQNAPAPLNAGFRAQQPPPGGLTFSYSGYMPQQPNQQQQQPLILPPKTLQQANQERILSPINSNPPQSARQASLEQSPAPPASANNNTNNPIPYANGRGPSARPARSTRSSHSKRATSAALANEEQSFLKEEEDANMYDSSSAGNISFSNTNTQNIASATANKAAASKNGKKGKKQGARAGSTGAATTSTTNTSSNASNNNNNNGKDTTSKHNNNTAPAFAAYGDFLGNTGGIGDGSGGGAGDDEEEGDDEDKRKAFLERNRQAACRSRQKKKEWINNLETHAARLQSENQSLAAEIDTLRKELFALRHTLSFHERSGCTAKPVAGGALAPQHQLPQPSSATLPHHHHQQQQHALPPPGLVQQQQRPEWRQPQQPVQQPPQQQQQQQQEGMNSKSQAPAIVQTHPSPRSQHASMQSGAVPPPPVHIQTQPQPMTARAGAGPTLAPSALQGMALPTSQQRPSSAVQAQQQHHLSLSQQRAPPKLNLSAASLQPQQQQQNTLQSMNGLAPPGQHPPSHGNQLGNSSDINRPGSAGATFGLSTPNFADLFNGAMGKLGAGGQTPFLGAGLLFTPGGIMSSGGMLGGGTGSNASGYNFSPGLPNTFGLSMQDIPIRPASAPPTPSPALDTRLVAPSQDYFTSKNLSSNLGTSAAFADFLAAYNPTNFQTGSVLA